MNRTFARTLAAFALGSLFAALPLQRPASAQVAIGGQIDFASDTDVGIGGRLLGDIPTVDLEAVGSFDLYFPDGPRDFWELNGNLFYHFHLRNTRAVLPYLGGGLNISHSSNGASRTEAGLNLGGGVRFPTAADISPFVELRGVVSDFEQFVVTFGLLFGDASGR